MNTNNAVQLQDKIDGHDIYPRTLASLVQTSDGSNIEDGKANKSDVYTKNEINTLLENKQSTLVSGTNIKTINNISLLGSGNLPLADLTEAKKSDSPTYKALKQGEEQMVVLKSMGDLDIIPLDSSLQKYDLNNDGAINYAEISILYSIMLGKKYDGFYYQVVNQIEGDTSSPLILQKSEDKTNWEDVVGKEPDINGNGSITGQDATGFYNLITSIAAQQGVEYNSDEFTGSTALFSVFDPKEKKIIIGYNFKDYIDPKYDKEDYTLLKLNPSPNVIYCNSFNNKLYRWCKTPEDRKMVELNSLATPTLRDVILRVEQVERQMKNLEGSVDTDPKTPVEPAES